MNCAEFQRVLPYIIESGGNTDEEEHLKSCPVCADLVKDLRYIADQAKLLVPMREPPSRVWSGIEKSLAREGLVRPAGARGRLLEPGRWRAVPWAAAVAALVLVVAGLFIARRDTSRETPSASVAPPATSVRFNMAIPTADDEQVLAAVAQNHPAMRASFEDSFQRVNAYISDAQQVFNDNPDDDEAWDTLLKAYEQKAMLYEMAISRSAQ